MYIKRMIEGIRRHVERCELGKMSGISEKARELYSDSSACFYKDFEDVYYMSWSPSGDLERVGSLSDVEAFLKSLEGMED